MHPLFALALVLGLLAPARDSLESVLGRKPLARAKVSVVVADADTGEVLFAQNAHKAMVPASNMKLLTTAAAITLLGPEFHFTTRLLSAVPPDASGVIAGDLVLWGSGDPCLRADALESQGIEDPAAVLTDLLLAAGVSRIDGALVLDDGLLDREWVHPDWDPKDLDFAYASPISALSMHGNCVEVAVDGRSGGRRPRAALVTDAEGYRLQNELRFASEPETNVVGVMRPDDTGVIRLRGQVSRGIGRRTYSAAVRDGALLFGRCMRAEFQQRGIVVRDGLERDAGAGRALSTPVELVRFETPLSLAVVLANKESDNSISDHMFKVLGAVIEGEGSFAAGGRAVLRFLSEFVGTDTEGLALADGSGLARTTQITASAMVDTLVAMNQAKHSIRDLFLRTLPVSGLDGTLQDRLGAPSYRGAVRAKTGYLRGVSALSGYVHTRSGRVLAFSILIGDVPGNYLNRDMKVIQDDICRDLVDRRW